MKKAMIQIMSEIAHSFNPRRSIESWRLHFSNMEEATFNETWSEFMELTR